MNLNNGFSPIWHRDRQSDLRDRPQRAFAGGRSDPAPAHLVNTLTITCHGNATAEQLLQRSKYDWFNDWINDERFPIPPHAPVTDELELYQFDHDPSHEDVISERARRKLGEPTYEHGFYLGIQHPDEQRKYPIAITHRPVRDPDGDYGILVLYGYSSGGHELNLGYPDHGWPRGCVFAGVRKAAP